MKLDRDGLPFIAIAAIPAAVAGLTGRRRSALALGALPVAVAAFFRDPDRLPDGEPSGDADLVVAPADAKVMHVGEPEPGAAPEGDWQQVSMFLSLADVHINRAPYGGTITEVTYRPGRYLAAFKAESGTENERSEITVVRTVGDEERTVVFRQVVGLAARRVVTRVAPGDVVHTGERIGLMKFGSRMDVFVPPGVEILVTPGTKVKAGETPLARWPQVAAVGAEVS
ncbi:phosphatidylserine decarboxylase [Aquihabitans sp. G128]|uniref:phosphatidylserine decarboxylase n=1 Tax=Aquihabitans sp. G128 TaxID=2849779 RepID=UPI001C23FBC7|nr:phosphatidylserine decarboxylase [Aquihabitans sp. G128]QXC63068.1 phosphatidylserine decarboxylase [Aquihabitans sp. G128]